MSRRRVGIVESDIRRCGRGAVEVVDIGAPRVEPSGVVTRCANHDARAGDGHRSAELVTRRRAGIVESRRRPWGLATGELINVGASRAARSGFVKRRPDHHSRTGDRNRMAKAVIPRQAGIVQLGPRSANDNLHRVGDATRAVVVQGFGVELDVSRR